MKVTNRPTGNSQTTADLGEPEEEEKEAEEEEEGSSLLEVREVLFWLCAFTHRPQTVTGPGYVRLCEVSELA